MPPTSRLQPITSIARAALGAHRRLPIRAGLGGLAAYLVLAPLLAVIHQALVAAGAVVLPFVAEYAASAWLPRLPIDPVYGGAALDILGGIQLHGLAVAGPLGDALHAASPGLFAAPGHVAPGALASAVIEPGPTIVAGALARLMATIPLLAIGIGLARRPGLPTWAAFAAVLVQAHLLVEQYAESQLTVHELEAAGVSFAISAFAPVAADGQRPLFTRQLEEVPNAAVSAGSALFLAALAYLMAAGMVGGLGLLGRVVRRSGWAATPSARRRPTPLWQTAARGAAAAAICLTLISSPLGALADSETSVLGDEQPPGIHALTGATGSASVNRTAQSARIGPSVVAVEGQSYQYRYVVNGAPTVIRGVGYNPWYAGLSREERAQRYDRDFAVIARIGANTLEGWFEEQFDELTLDAAHAHGLGVLMPFELNQDYDYADPQVQAMFLQQVSDWVLRYRGHPAVRMWAPGNEVLHRLIDPTMLGGAPDPEREHRADAFVSFYVKLMDRMHALDPNHPVLYRGAEDGYFWRLREAMLRDGVARPWFVYGTNAYTPRLEQIVDQWPSQGCDCPLLVSEFAPGGVASSGRPQRLKWFWATIRSHPERVLGGVVYTWAAVGPEDLDRVFGLTDEYGWPRDGSVGALARLFQADRAATELQAAQARAWESRQGEGT